MAIATTSTTTIKDNMECPICWETIDTQINCLTTQCGHTFHGNCFMMHTAHNGYSCPCCRHQLIDNPKVESDDEDEDEDEDDEYDEESLGSQDTRQYNFGGRFILKEDETMFSFRWFYQRLHGEELEEDEYGLSGPDPSDDDQDVMYDENKEQVENLTKRMKQINKLSYEKLLAAFMYKNCKDFRYNYYAEDMCSNVSRMIDDIHQRMLCESKSHTHYIAQVQSQS